MKNKIDEANKALKKMTARWINACQTEDALSELFNKKQLSIEQFTREKALLEGRVYEGSILNTIAINPRRFRAGLKWKW